MGLFSNALKSSTVFVYSPSAIPLEEEQYQSLNTAAVIFQNSMFSPDNGASTRSIVKSSYGIDNTNIHRLENSIFSHKIIGESKDKYIEVNYIKNNAEIDGEIKTVYYRIALDIDSTTLNPYGIAMVSHDYHTMLSTMKFAD